ncbi:hypothetical protein [Sutcliffiella halmapala]|uniref:hypothetical protein n=1 Tax=Sutcliffiella halmapala TaxID=79882 RepID=UPI000994BE36|nr:hypothetical protein [Sutcliffiella halmapala]
MRPKQRINKDQLENLLRQMPKVKDERDSSQIYSEVQIGLNKKPRKFKVMPTIALAAAIMIFAIITPLFFQNMTSQNSSMDDAAQETKRSGIMEYSNFNDDAADSETGNQLESINKIDGNNAVEDEKPNEIMTTDVKNQTFVVSNLDEETNHIVTIGVTAHSESAMSDDGGFTFPISLIVSKNEEESYFSALERIRYELNYAELGLEEPLINQGAVLSMAYSAGGTPMTMIEVGELYMSYSSMQQTTLLNEIDETLRWTPYTYHEFTSNGSNKGVAIGNSEYNESISMTVFAKRPYFKYQASEQTPIFLVRSQTEFATITEAINTMKTKPDQYPDNKVDPSIPSTIQIENVQTDDAEDGTVRIILSPSSVLTNTEETIFALEAMLMTAKEFGFQKVIFESTQDGIIGNIQLNEPVDVPYSPNPIPYPL